MKSLIVGMGIGALYKNVLENLGHQVVTVDLTKSADYKNLSDALHQHGQFDTINICTPNFTHESIAYEVADRTKILFIEKPGLQTYDKWSRLIESFPSTRIMMVKNNMWRNNIDDMREKYSKSTEIHAHWLNENRVPNPGSWFTTKQLSFGGVSRDLLPHLLSFIVALDDDYNKAQQLYRHSWQRWNLADMISSEYGFVDLTGKYDVDDHVELEYTINNRRWFIKTSWKTNKPSDISISIGDTKYELGLCPESAYSKMIKDAMSNIDNDVYWQNQYYQDLWIHNNINL
jgi:predicted dehydrogenase